MNVTCRPATPSERAAGIAQVYRADDGIVWATEYVPLTGTWIAPTCFLPFDEAPAPQVCPDVAAVLSPTTIDEVRAALIDHFIDRAWRGAGGGYV